LLGSQWHPSRLQLSCLSHYIQCQVSACPSFRLHSHDHWPFVGWWPGRNCDLIIHRSGREGEEHVHFWRVAKWRFGMGFVHQQADPKHELLSCYTQQRWSASDSAHRSKLRSPRRRVLAEQAFRKQCIYNIQMRHRLSRKSPILLFSAKETNQSTKTR